jgi:hypothetical protein
MSRNMQARQATALVPRDWPSMAAASATICRSSRANGRAGAANYAVLSLVTPEPLDADVPRLEARTEYTAVAQLEGQIVVTLTPKGTTGEPMTLTIPLMATVAGAEGLTPAGPAEE